MRILYLTPLWYGFKEMLFEGQRDVQGLPSFLFPLKGLVDGGHSVDFVILSTSSELPELNIRSDWLSQCDIMGFCYYDSRALGKAVSVLKLRRLVSAVLAKRKYDFVYAHGTSAGVARDVVKKNGVPFGQRLYGTFLWDKMERLGVRVACARHFLEYLSFTREKDFLLVTNDGSRGDLVIKTLFPGIRPPFEFLYWLNGVNRVEVNQEEIQAFTRERGLARPFIFYCARFDAWKRQDRAVRVIDRLRSDGVRVDLYFAGPFDTLGDDYYRSIKREVAAKGLEHQVVFLGNVSRKEIHLYNRIAVASLSLYDVCNVTSVFHEMMSDGALVIVKSDEEVRGFIEHGVNGFLVDDENGAVEVVKKVIHDKDYQSEIRAAVVATSRRLTRDWHERVTDEVKLISRYAVGT